MSLCMGASPTIFFEVAMRIEEACMGDFLPDCNSETTRERRVENFQLAQLYIQGSNPDVQ